MISQIEVNEFVNKFTTSQDSILEELERETFQKTVYPQMMCSIEQGKILQFISQMLRPKYILEIGTFTGYSAICLSKGLAKGGKLITIDRNEELSFISNKYFQQADYIDKIYPVYGEAIEIISNINHSFDLVYIDGDKKQYTQFYKTVLPKLHSGSIILVDNVFWYNKLLNNALNKDADTIALEEFLNTVNEDILTENTIIPLCDGVMIIRVK